MNRILPLTVLASLLSFGAYAQDSTLTRLIQKNRYPLSLSGQQFGGTGWDKLQQSIQRSQFVLIGEDHGIAQIPVFAAAVAQVQKPAAYVAEIDAYQAQELRRLATQPAQPAAYLKQYTNGLSFYSWGEEFELVRQLRTQNVPVIGIDQVNFTGTGRFYELLAEKSKNKQTKTYLLSRAKAYQTHDEATMRKGAGNYSMFTQKQSAIDSLLLFARKESPEVQRMVQDYVASYKIYLGQTNGTGGHQERINLMKRNLLYSLRPLQPAPYEPLPKLLFKFGANHMARTLSPWAGITDVGNLVQNLADVQDAKSLHIIIMGKEGTQVGGFYPEEPSKNIAPLKPTDNPFLKPFFDQMSGPAWQVFDLRPLRSALLNDKLKVANQKQEGIILGYDYMVVIPEATASRTF